MDFFNKIAYIPRFKKKEKLNNVVLGILELKK